MKRGSDSPAAENYLRLLLLFATPEAHQKEGLKRQDLFLWQAFLGTRKLSSESHLNVCYPRKFCLTYGIPL